MYNNFELLIEANHGLLTKNEKRVANFLIDNPNIIISNDIITAANTMFISKSTLTRFCTKLGLENYKELKYILKQNENQKTSSKQQLDSVIDEFHNEYTNILNKFKLTVDDKIIEKSVQYITNPKHTYIIGIGQSGYLAQDLSLRLSRMGLKVTALSDIHIIQMTCGMCTKDDLFIFLSNSGKTKIINTALSQVSEKGCNTILLSEFNQSNASKQSTLTILTPQKSNLQFSNSISDTFGLNLVSDLIFHYVYNSNDDFKSTYSKTIINHDEI